MDNFNKEYLETYKNYFPSDEYSDLIQKTVKDLETFKQCSSVDLHFTESPLLYVNCLTAIHSINHCSPKGIFLLSQQG